MVTLIVDPQTEYFLSLIRRDNLEEYFVDSCPPQEVEIVIVKTTSIVDRSFLDKYPKLKMVIRAGSGYDNIDLAAAGERNVAVCNTPAANSRCAFEHTLALILAMIKQLQPSKKNILNSTWKENLCWNKEISELKVLVVGVGRIGSKVALALKSLGADVMGVDPYLAPECWKELDIVSVSYEEGLRIADLITFHCPLTQETGDYFSQKSLHSLNQPIWLVNTARGRIVNEEALFEGLQSGMIIAAGLDVFASEPNPQLPFDCFENVYLTPHTGAYTIAAKKRLAEELLQVWKSFVFEGRVCSRVSA